jgi:casein kinase II subunit beta
MSAARGGQLLGEGEEEEVEDINGEQSEEEEESSQTSTSESEYSWVIWFLNQKGNEYFCEIDRDYLQDEFNHTGLSSEVCFHI